MPKVSIIIPCYNTEKYIRRCLDSLAGQTLSDIEVLCIDDGSTDNSYARRCALPRENNQAI